jgi:beta-glucosidase
MMKRFHKTLIFSIYILVCFPIFAQHEVKVEKLLKQMTLEEKVGQMSEVTVDILMDNKTWVLNDSFLQKGIVDYKIGSVLNTWDNVAHSKEEWSALVKKLQSIAHKTRLKIPLIYGVDAIHGATYTNKATLFPQEIAMAATFNRSLVKRGAEICAYETRAGSLPWTFSPVLDLGIDARWPRLWETFGEDPYLASAMATEMTKGYQGIDANNIDKYHVAACAKHYLGYSVPVSGKDRTPAIISENVLREYHLPSFQAAIDAGISSVMVNSGLINGIPVHSSHFLLTDLLKKELGFKGVVVTDWMDIENLYMRDHLAISSKDAVKLAINAGIDMAMIPYNFKFCDYLIELVNEGAVPIERIDDAVRRILKMKMKLNLFEQPFDKTEDYPLFGSKEFEHDSYIAASEAITLLKNTNNVLPLSKNKKVLVCGPNANSMRSLNGGWSYSWQGEKAEQFTKQYSTILKAIQNKIGTTNVTYAPGVLYNETGKYWEENEVSIPDAVEKAKNVDCVVLCLGENSYTEKPGDLHDLTLSDLQIRLANELAATGKPIILVLNEGRPRIISKFEGKMAATVMAFLPSNFGGDALADILFGDVNPSGKLPITYPRYPNSLINYWHKYSEEQVKAEGMYNYESDYSPLYEFGTGLSYTTFKYSDLKLSKKEIIANEILQVSVTVTNTGKVAGKEAVLLYLSDLYASLAPDMKRLKGFDKINLQPGESKTVEFSLTKKELSFVNHDSKTISEPGDFVVKVGDQKAAFTLK